MSKERKNGNSFNFFANFFFIVEFDQMIDEIESTERPGPRDRSQEDQVRKDQILQKLLQIWIILTYWTWSYWILSNSIWSF
jgi:hypothetical protein